MTIRPQRLLAAVVLALAVGGVALTLAQPQLSRRTADFTIGYSVATMIRSGQADQIYDQGKLGAVMERVAGAAPFNTRLPYSQPLAAGVLFVPLSFLPLDVALRLWQAICLGVMLLAFLVLQKTVPLAPRAPVLASAALLASAPAWATLTEGQQTPLLLLGASLLVSAGIDNRAVLAGPGAALLALKPQYVPAYLLLLCAWRRWRCLMPALAGAAAVALSPLAAGGPAGLEAMVQRAVAGDHMLPSHLMEGWVGAIGSVLPDTAAREIGAGMTAIAGAALLALAIWPRLAPYALACLAGLIAVLGSPHSLPHDLVLLAVPAWLAFALHKKGWLASPIPGLVLVDVAIILDLLGTPASLGAIALTGALLWYANDFRQRWGRRTHPLPAAA